MLRGRGAAARDLTARAPHDLAARRRSPRLRDDRGVSLYLEYLALLVLLGSIVVLVTSSSVPHQLSCFVEKGVVLFRGGAGTVCGETLEGTPVPQGSTSPTPMLLDR